MRLRNTDWGDSVCADTPSSSDCVEKLRGNKALASAFSAITAAVVGVILNLAVWFSIHTLFRNVGESQQGPLRRPRPEWSSIDVAVLAIAALAFALTFRWNRRMGTTLIVCAVLGLLVVWLRQPPLIQRIH